MRSALGVYLQPGQIDKAEAHFATVAASANIPEPAKALSVAFVAPARAGTRLAGLARARRRGRRELCCALIIYSLALTVMLGCLCADEGCPFFFLVSGLAGHLAMAILS